MGRQRRTESQRMLVLLLPQFHPKGPAATAGGPKRRADGGPKGQEGSVPQLPFHIIVDVGEGLAGGNVGHPAPGREAAAGARAERRVPVAGVQGQVELSFGPGRLGVSPFCSTHRQSFKATARLRMVAGCDGGDLDAGAVKGSGVLLGPVLGPLGLVANQLVLVSGGEVGRVTLQLLDDRLLGHSLRRAVWRPHMETWTCAV